MMSMADKPSDDSHEGGQHLPVVKVDSTHADRPGSTPSAGRKKICSWPPLPDLIDVQI